MSMSRYVLPDISNSSAESLLIGISSSGEVARTIEAAEIAKSLGIQTLAITLNSQSTLSRTADATLSLVVPPYPEGPGLISYLSSYLLGLSVVGALADREFDKAVVPAVGTCPDLLEEWIPQQIKKGRAYARKVRYPHCVFVGSGYAYGSALFGAAKVMEAAGEYVGAQDVEEWAHLEYFCNPADTPMWLLGAEGRSSSREGEILTAADAIKRDVLTSIWQGSKDWSSRIREITAPLALWSGPVGYAIERANLLSEVPFRGFGGGRSKREGGGPSRIRSSQRIPRSKLT
jgi:glucosamine--fructose-6-phosphate aminotransferase (isomerizing)